MLRVGFVVVLARFGRTYTCRPGVKAVAAGFIVAVSTFTEPAPAMYELGKKSDTPTLWYPGAAVDAVLFPQNL